MSNAFKPQLKHTHILDSHCRINTVSFMCCRWPFLEKFSLPQLVYAKSWTTGTVRQAFGLKFLADIILIISTIIGSSIYIRVRITCCYSVRNYFWNWLTSKLTKLIFDLFGNKFNLAVSFVKCVLSYYKMEGWKASCVVFGIIYSWPTRNYQGHA